MAQIKINHTKGVFLVQSEEILHTLFNTEKSTCFITYRNPMHRRSELAFTDTDACKAEADSTYDQICKAEEGY